MAQKPMRVKTEQSTVSIFGADSKPAVPAASEQPAPGPSKPVRRGEAVAADSHMDLHGESRGWWWNRYHAGDQAGLKPHAQDALLSDKQLTAPGYKPQERERALGAGCTSREAQDRGALMHAVETQRRAELLCEGTPMAKAHRQERQEAFANLVRHDQAHGHRIGSAADISREIGPQQRLSNDMARANRTAPTAEMHQDFNREVERVRSHPEMTVSGRTAISADHQARTVSLGPRRQDIPAGLEPVTRAPQPAPAPKPAPRLIDAMRIKV